MFPSNKHTFISLLIIYSCTISTVPALNCRSTDCSCTTDEPCILNCIGKDQCKGSDVKLTCQPSQTCTITCNGVAACQDAKINANGASNTTLICIGGKDVCSGSTSFTCGNGHCSVYCDDSSSTSCKSIYIDTKTAETYECTGNCPRNLSPFYVNPATPSPTTSNNNNNIPSAPSTPTTNSVPTNPIYWTMTTTKKKDDVIFVEESNSDDTMFWNIIVAIIVFVVFVVLCVVCYILCKQQKKANGKRGKWRRNNNHKEWKNSVDIEDSMEKMVDNVVDNENMEGNKKGNEDDLGYKQNTNNVAIDRSITISDQQMEILQDEENKNLSENDSDLSSNSEPPPPPPGPPPTKGMIDAGIALPMETYTPIGPQDGINKSKQTI